MGARPKKEKKPRRPSRRERRIKELEAAGYRPQVSKHNPVQLYRSYGKKRIENEDVERANLFLVRALAGVILFLLALAFGLGAFAVLTMSPLLIKTLLWGAIIYFLVRFVTKIPRKRYALLRKLRAICRKNGWSISVGKGFFHPFRWCDDGGGLKVETPYTVYHLDLVGVPLYGSVLCLEPDGELTLTRKPPRSIFTVIFSPKAFIRSGRVDFGNIPERFDKKQMKILLVCPVCREIKYRVSDHVCSITGNGGEHFGYTVFTSTGFLNYIERSEDDEKKRDPYGM